MKKYHLMFCQILIIFQVGCSTDTNKNSLEAEIYELFNRSLEMIKAKDVEGLADRFTQNGEIKRSSTPIITGYEAIRESYAALVNLEDLKITADNLKIEISESGDMAYVLSDYSTSYHTPEGKYQEMGKRLLCLKRMNSQWKIAIEMLSSNHETD